MGVSGEVVVQNAVMMCLFVGTVGVCSSQKRKGHKLLRKSVPLDLRFRVLRSLSKTMKHVLRARWTSRLLAVPGVTDRNREKV